MHPPKRPADVSSSCESTLRIQNYSRVILLDELELQQPCTRRTSSAGQSRIDIDRRPLKPKQGVAGAEQLEDGQTWIFIAKDPKTQGPSAIHIENPGQHRSGLGLGCERLNTGIIDAHFRLAGPQESTN